MEKYTPGPWEVFEGPEDRPELTVVYEDKTGQLVQVCDCLSGDVPPKERKGNALLIAAAPELLETAKLLASLRDYPTHEIIDFALKSIAKAEGR